MTKKCPINESLGDICGDGRWCAECQEQHEDYQAWQERELEQGLEAALMIHLPEE